MIVNTIGAPTNEPLTDGCSRIPNCDYVGAQRAHFWAPVWTLYQIDNKLLDIEIHFVTAVYATFIYFNSALLFTFFKQVVGVVFTRLDE